METHWKTHDTSSKLKAIPSSLRRCNMLNLYTVSSLSKKFCNTNGMILFNHEKQLEGQIV